MVNCSFWRIRPIKIGDKWGLGIENQCSAYVPNDDYPEVKWSDEEPRELVLKPINKRTIWKQMIKEESKK